MAVRVRVRIARAGRAPAPEIETVAVANSGFEADDPEALVPVRLAQHLGLWPPPPGSRAERFESPAGALALVMVPRAVRVAVAGTRRFVFANAVVSERESELVMNDWLVDRLGIDLLASGRGLWRLGTRGPVRRSARSETW